MACKASVCAVYILTNISNTVLYVGATNNLLRRISEHRALKRDSFTSRYKIIKLVYFEPCSIETVYKREKQIKNLLRSKKIQLIDNFNPDWKDLFRHLA